MTLRTRFNVLTIVLLGLSTFCYASDNCGFGIGCPNVVPPCYRVEFSGVRECSDRKCIDLILYDFLNKTWKLKNHDGACRWSNTKSDAGYNVRVETYAGGVHVQDEDEETFMADGPHPNGVNISNDLTCHDCRGRGGGGFAGMASYEAVWDCNWCNNCETLPIDVYQEPAYYPNKNCCPVPPFGKSIVRMKCDAAEYVVPECEIEIRDPAGNWVVTPNSPVVTVFSDPNACSADDEVTFHITTFPATPPLDPPVRVKCTGSFWDIKKLTRSRTVFVYPEPGCTPCCAACAGGVAACVPLPAACSSGVILPPMPK